MKTKADIEYHSDGYRSHKPAVNVKVHDDINDGYRAFVKHSGEDIDPLFTEEWIEEHISEERMYSYWERAIESSWENLQNDAVEIFGQGTKVYAEGRQGGWAYIDGMTADDVESWDAIEFGKWRRFAKYARAQADDVMYLVVDGIYYNAFQAWKDERSETLAPDFETALGGR
jgi:hypothetical protein